MWCSSVSSSCSCSKRSNVGGSSVIYSAGVSLGGMSGGCSSPMTTTTTTPTTTPLPLLWRVSSVPKEARKITTYAMTKYLLVSQTPVPTGLLHSSTVLVVVVVVERTRNVPHYQTVWGDTSRCGVGPHIVIRARGVGPTGLYK